VLHARIAEILESQFAEIAESQPELLARHYTKADLIEKSARLWGKAGQRSQERSALVEAAEQLSQALAQIATLPSTSDLRREQIILHVALLNTLMHVKGYGAPETKAAVAQVRALIEQAERLGEPPDDPSLLLGYPEAALHDADCALMEARQIEHAATLMFTLNFPILVNTYCGNYHAANDHLKELVVLAEEKGAPFRKAEGVLRRGYILTLTVAAKAVEIVTAGIGLWRAARSTVISAEHGVMLGIAPGNLR